MRFRKWKNQYIDAVETKPDFILSADSGDFSKESLLHLEKKMSGFKNLYCEIGSGSGAYLIESAKRDPESFYCGIELRFKRAFRTAEKAEEAGVSNLFVVRGDARQLGEIFGSRPISGIFINFPDPWNKKKWRKHRMMSEENLAYFCKHLTVDGFIALKTDHEGYFKDALSLLDTVPYLTTEWSTHDLWASEHAENNIPTEFEMLFRSKGQPVYALKARK